MFKSKFVPGFLLIEVLLSVALFALLVAGLAGAIIYLQQNAVLATQADQALMLAGEGLEAARSMAASGFSGLADGNFGLVISGGAWTLSVQSDQTGMFTRQLAISNISPTVKQITSTITWSQNLQRPGSISLVTEVSDWRGN
jgi:type II secretory pathway pseudopilin PulG